MSIKLYQFFVIKYKASPVNGMLTSEVIPVIIKQIFTPHFGHQKATVMVMNDQHPSL